MKFSLLASTDWVSYVLIGVLVVILVASMIIMNRRSKKREQEAQELIDAVKPGNKVTTIGGIVGIVVEVNPDDNTIILETGSEDHGKSYIKFIRQAIYESDAVVDKKEVEAKAEEMTGEEATSVNQSEEVAPVEETAEVAPVEETAEESKPQKKKKN